MARRGKNVPEAENVAKAATKKSRRRSEGAGASGLPAGYRKACELARDGSVDRPKLPKAPAAVCIAMRVLFLDRVQRE
jgi:hypothetical protein